MDRHSRINLAASIMPASNHRYASLALGMAARHCHAECVKLPIPAAEPNATNSAAVRSAADRGHAECVKLLLPVSGSLSR